VGDVVMTEVLAMVDISAVKANSRNVYPGPVIS